MKRFIKLIAIILALFAIIGVLPISNVNAASNEITAFTKYLPKVSAQLKKDSYLPYSSVKYAFFDINNDGKKEMLAYDSMNPYSKGYIYQYKNKKVTRIKCVSNFQPNRNISGIEIKIYKKKKMFKTGAVSESTSGQYYYKYKRGKYVLVAESGTKSDFETGNDIKYYKVNGKKVSKSKFKKYVKILVKGAKAKKASTLNWYEY